MKQNKSRYLNSFFITFGMYAILLLVLFYGSKNIIKNIESKDHKVISLNHVVLKQEQQKTIQVAQKKIIKEKKVEKKKKSDKKVILKKVVKKVKQQEPKKIVKKITEKKVPKKIEPFKKEVVKKKTVKSDIVKKEVEKKTQKKSEPLKQVKKQALVKKSIHTAKKKKPQKVDYEKEYLSVNLKKILTEIQKNIRYPKVARRRGIEGTVNIEFKLYPNGSIGLIKLLTGHKLLKKSALKAIEKASVNFPKVAKPILLRLPISYTLS